MKDVKFCSSSYLAYRYIEDENKDFFDNKHHINYEPIPDKQRIFVHTADEIGQNIQSQLSKFKNKKIGILLSGGMDSAICASYLPGQTAYTFRFLNGNFQKQELERAEYYSKQYDINLKYVDINWKTVEKYVDSVMEKKNAPVHSIEPQILQAALQAKDDGIELMVVGESADLIFGGMDQLLSKDWTFEEFKNRYTFTKPEDVLKDPVDVYYLFEKYRDGNSIRLLDFMDNVFSIESSSSYLNAFGVADMPYFDPYAKLKMADKLDLNRVRNGEPKYLIRELMKKRYPDIPVPNKITMPRPVDEYFKNWNGPVRPEFKKNLDMKKFTGNQKWQIWCLERFLNNNF